MMTVWRIRECCVRQLYTHNCRAHIHEQLLKLSADLGLGCFVRLFKPDLHDTTGCQTGWTTGWTTGWMFVYTVQPVVQPVWQPVVSCKRSLTINGSPIAILRTIVLYLFHHVDLLLRSYLYHCVRSVITAHNLTPEKRDHNYSPRPLTPTLCLRNSIQLITGILPCCGCL